VQDEARHPQVVRHVYPLTWAHLVLPLREGRGDGGTGGRGAR
jgi:hypothetical protein